MKETRVEVRIRNNVLWHAIYDVWPSVSAFCREHGFVDASVGELLNLKASPLSTKGEYRPLCLKLAQVLGYLPEDLFPLPLYNITTTRAVAEFSFAELPKHVRREMLRLPAPETPFEVVAQNEARRAVAQALATFSPRDQEIIRLGLIDEVGCTEIAKKFGLSKSRVNQIERRACMKLRQKHFLLEKFVSELEPG